MGTCRMGIDPQTSVANPYGELHDTPGVWIGDASAFPTPSGTNPMITIMALAHRTAEASPAASPAGRRRRHRTARRKTRMATHTDAPHPRQLYIGGEWVEPAGDGTIEVVNPATEEVIGRVPEGTAEDVDRAVAAARTAFETWSQRRSTSALALLRRRSAPSSPSAATRSRR